MWSAPPVAPLHDLLALHSPSGAPAASQQHDACWTRGEPQCSGSMELSAGRLAQHSMHLVDPESCLPLSFDVPTTWPRSVPSKVAPRSDDEGRRGWPTGDDHSRAVYESVLRCCVFYRRLVWPPDSLHAPQEHLWRSVPLKSGLVAPRTLGAKRCLSIVGPMSGLSDGSDPTYAPGTGG